MKKILFVALLAAIAVSCIGSSAIKGSGKAVKGEFDINTNYTELTVSNGITVVLVPSEKSTGTITADEMVMDYVSITEKNGKVRVKYDPQVQVRSKVETIVTIPISRSITTLKAGSAAILRAEAQILAQTLTVESSSAAKVTLDVEARELFVDVDSAADCVITGTCGVCKISGDSAAKLTGRLTARECYADFDSAASCTMKGTADYCKVEVDSAADFNGYEFICKKADVDASSAGSVKITATEEFGVSVSSGGSVKYKGEPRLTSHNVSSGGSLKKAD